MLEGRQEKQVKTVLRKIVNEGRKREEGGEERKR